MRIIGWTLLVVGVVFEALLVLAAFGDGKLSPVAFGMPGMLIITGWRLKKHGKGLLNRRLAPSAPSPNIELPFTPAVESAIHADLAHGRRVISWICGIGFASFLVLGAAGGVIAILGPLGLGFAAIVGGAWWFSRERPARRDLRSAHYLRTAGPVALLAVRGGHLLRLADRAFLVGSGPAVKTLANLHWAVIEYTPHAHVILEVRSQAGETLYSAFRDSQPFGLGAPAARA